MLGLAALLGGGRTARAESVTATLQTVDPFVFGTVYLAGDGDIGGGIGGIVWQGSPSNASPFNGTFVTYCIDLQEEIDLGGTYTFRTNPVALSPKASAFPGDISGGMGVAKFDEIAELFGQHYGNTLGASHGVDREAFQLAIWDIVYDTDISVSPGDGAFYATSDVDPNAIGLANCWLADAANPNDQAIYHANNLIALIGCPGVQDQITVLPCINVGTGAPLPSSAAGGSLLLAGFFILRACKRRDALSGRI